MRYTRPLSVCSETKLSLSFLRTTPARKPRTECCCHSVAVARDAIVAPAGVRSIAMTWSCLVPSRATGFDDAVAGRLLDLRLRGFRKADRVAVLVVDLGLVMGSSEVCATPSAAPPQPRPDNHPAGQDPEARLSRSKSPQQRSVQTRKPVNSEQDNCSSGIKPRQAHNLKVIGSNPIPPTRQNPANSISWRAFSCSNLPQIATAWANSTNADKS